MGIKSNNKCKVLSYSSINELDSFRNNNGAQQDFLRLMVAQIQNQVSTQSNEEFSSPITKIQGPLQHMATSLQSNRALQASALVGRQVLVLNHNLKLDKIATIKIVLDVPPGVRELEATFYTATNELIKTLSLGSPHPGIFQFCWDGLGADNKRLQEGKYKITVQGLADDAEVILQTMTFANVESVSLSPHKEGLKLNVAGIGSLSLDDVKQILV